MICEFNKDIVQKALFFASIKHGEQKMGRPPKQIPYVTHFCGVALNVINFASCEQVDKTFMLTLALLHDTLEDTITTHEELVQEFGVRVADGVKALSRNPELPLEKQIPDCVERIKGQPKEVAIVKMADRLINIRKRFSGWTKEKQDAYKIEAQFICDELGYVSKNLKQALQEAINKY